MSLCDKSILNLINVLEVKTYYWFSVDYEEMLKLRNDTIWFVTLKLLEITLIILI